MPNGLKDPHILISFDRDIDPEDLDISLRRLSDELLDVEGVKNVERPALDSGDVPVNAKVVDPISIGTIILTLAASGGVITTLINAFQSWLSRTERQSFSVKIGDTEIRLTGKISETTIHELKSAWLSYVSEHKK